MKVTLIYGSGGGEACTAGGKYSGEWKPDTWRDLDEGSIRKLTSQGFSFSIPWPETPESVHYQPEGVARNMTQRMMFLKYKQQFEGQPRYPLCAPKGWEGAEPDTIAKFQACGYQSAAFEIGEIKKLPQSVIDFLLSHDPDKFTTSPSEDEIEENKRLAIHWGKPYKEPLFPDLADLQKEFKRVTTEIKHLKDPALHPAEVAALQNELISFEGLIAKEQKRQADERAWLIECAT